MTNYHNKKNNLKYAFSPKRFFQSLRHAIRGIFTVAASEPNFSIHLVIGSLTIALGLFLNIQLWEWTMLTLTIGIVLTAEIFNTSIEHLTDLASPEIHPLAKKAKDTAAGAVLLTSLMAIIVGSLIFLPKILEYFT